MSMLTGQVEGLRKTAYEVERIKDNNADWLWRDGITLADAARQLREAADTITDLRSRLTESQTCHMELLPDEPTTSIQPMRCTACGHKTYAQLASYCPSCGRKVVE